MLDLFSAVKEWSGFVVLVLLGWLLRKSVSIGYRTVKRRLDSRHPDNLPVGAGQWLEEEVAHRSLEVNVLVSPTPEEDCDAILPSARIIILSQATYYKNDPSFWAIAAHELGHLLVYRHAIWIRVPFLMARVVRRSFISAGTFLILANVMFAAREISTLAFSLLLAGLVASVVVIVDEACASTVAIRILARDRRVDRHALSGVVFALFAAFMTYIGGFVGSLLLVLERAFITTRIEQHRYFVPGHSLGAGQLVLAGTLSVVLLLLAGRAIFLSLRSPNAVSTKEVTSNQLRSMGADLLRSVLALGFVALVWNQPFGVAFAVACVLAVLASRTLVTLVLFVLEALLRLVVILVVLMVWYPFALAWVVLSQLFNGSDWEDGARPKSAKVSSVNTSTAPPPSADVKRSEAALAAARLELHNRPRWYMRLATITFASCHVLVVIAFWASLAQTASP